MPSPLVHILVLNWNGLEHLKTCFDSLRELDYPNCRIAMVDNGSTDGSVEFVRKNYPSVEVVQNGKNLGFARGNNRGIRHAIREGADYVCLLNNDMEVDQAWVRELVARAESDPSIGACASKMLYYFNRPFINGVGTCINRYAVGWDQHDGRLDSGRVEIDEECLGFCAGACLIRAAALKKVGLLDPFYFIYSEDTDLCVRMWKKGWRIVTAPRAVAYHKFSATMKEGSAWKEYLLLKNRLYFIAKLYPWRELRSTLPEVLREGVRRAKTWKWCGRRAHMRGLLKAIVRFHLAIPRIALYRLLHGTTFTDRSWAMIKAAKAAPVEGVLLRDPSKVPVTLHDRIVMRTDDSGLGEGWYVHQDVKDRPGGNILYSFRWTTDRALARLRAHRAGDLLLTLALSNPYRNNQEVTVRLQVNGSEIGKCSPGAGWRSFVFPFHSRTTDVELAILSEPVMPPGVTGQPRDLGVRVREIGVAPAGQTVR